MAVTSAVAGVVGTVGSLAMAGSAADAQGNAVGQANDAQMQMYRQMREDLLPYMQTGMAGNTQLKTLAGLDEGGNPLTSPLLKPVVMDQAALEQTPGYQFNLKQGLKAVQNSASARGLASSGAALRGAADYTTGLADNTYQQQFSNAVTNQTNLFDRLMGITQLGQNSAAGVGAAGIQTGTNIGNNLVGAGNAQAASKIAQGNILSGIGPQVGMFGNSLFGPSSQSMNNTQVAVNQLINDRPDIF